MRVLLNITRAEAKKVNGDVSFYRNLLTLKTSEFEFQIVEGALHVRRSARKVFERLLQLPLMPPLRRWLLRKARLSYISRRASRDSDVVLSHIVFPSIRHGNRPVIWSSQGISPPWYYDATGPFSQKEVVNLYDDLGNRADLLLIWTESGARRVRELCSITTPIAVLPPIVEVPPVLPTTRVLPPKTAACQLLFVGRDPVRKGLFDLLQAFRGVHSRGGDVALDVVSVLTAEQETECRAIPGVTSYTGIPDSLIAELMDRADVLVLPTYAETYGFVLVEAMARGCALIAPDYEPLNELVIDQQNGFTFPLANVAALERALESIAQDPSLLQRFRDASRRRYDLEFSVETLVPRYSSMFRAVADGSCCAAPARTPAVPANG